MRASRRIKPMPSRPSGVSLLEVLIAVLIMGVGLLGIAAMQATALRNSQSSFERTQAVIQTNTILDAMRANRVSALAGAYDTDCTVPTGTTLNARDVIAWLGSLKATMGRAGDETTCGSIDCNAATGICEIGITWDDSRATEAGSDGDDAGITVAGSTTRQVMTRVRL